MQRDVNKLFQELQETYDNLVELRGDGYYVTAPQIIAAAYSKVGYLQALANNNPDFINKRELGALIEKIDHFFGINRENIKPQEEPEK